MRFLVLSTLLTLAACRQKRFIGPLSSIGSGLASIGSIFSPTPAPHAKFPAYKVHKYTGIQLKPISHEELAALQPVEHVRHEYGFKEAEGHPPKVFDVIPEYYPEPYHSEPYPASDREAQAALAAIDSLGGLANFLPEGARGRSLDLNDKSGEEAEGDAEDRIGLLRRKPLKLKKKALLALLTLKGGPKGGLGLGGLGGLGGLSSGFQSLYNYASPAEELPSEGPYPGHTTVYRVPATSSPSGFLSGLFFGRENEGIPLELPEPSLPEIPELKVVPEAPKLPHFTLPGNYKLPYSTGSYVSIKVPKPHIPLPAPAPVYGTPASEYGTPAVEYGTPAAEYGTPAAEYGTPAAEYGTPLKEYIAPPAIEYSLPPTEYAIHLPEYHTTTSYSYDVYNHGHNNQELQETFVPSAPAPPVYNSYQNQVTSYQAPVQEYSHSVDTSSLQGSYPPAVATAVFSHYPPPQGYSYLDNTHSPSEPKASVVPADTSSKPVATNRSEEDVDGKIITQQETEEQQLPEAPKEQETPNN